MVEAWPGPEECRIASQSFSSCYAHRQAKYQLEFANFLSNLLSIINVLPYLHDCIIQLRTIVCCSEDYMY